MSCWQNISIPLVLLSTGLVLMVGDSMGVLSLDRILNLWPLAIIVLGITELPSGR